MLHTTPQWLCSWSDRGGNGGTAKCLHSRDLASPCWQLDEGCCSLQLWCWMWNMHGPAGLSSTQRTGKCSPAASPGLGAAGHQQAGAETFSHVPWAPQTDQASCDHVMAPAACLISYFLQGRSMRCSTGNSHLVRGSWRTYRTWGWGVEICRVMCGSVGKEQKSSGTEGKRILGTKKLHLHSGDKHQRE